MSEETLVYKRVLRQVMLWNLGLLAGLGAAGWMADSSALMANAIDNGSDAAVYLLSYMAVDRASAWSGEQQPYPVSCCCCLPVLSWRTLCGAGCTAPSPWGLR